jgi:hypothetical protein
MESADRYLEELRCFAQAFLGIGQFMRTRQISQTFASFASATKNPMTP